MTPAIPETRTAEAERDLLDPTGVAFTRMLESLGCRVIDVTDHLPADRKDEVQ
jgi:hypothetical protein